MNLNGQKFNHLTVIGDESIKKNKHLYWLCECDCKEHTQKLIRQDSLINLHTKSCGCLNKINENLTKEIQIGTKFGRLTVLERDTSKVGKGAYWLCRCDCDKHNIISTLGANLRNGNKKSCGCLAIEHNLEFIENGKKYNTYDLTGEFGIGYTSNDEEFYFDLEDYDKIKSHYWAINNRKYVFTLINNKKVLLHRFILDVNNNMMVDHINHETWNNKKENLRICTNQQNGMNKNICINNTSGVTGVKLDKNSPIPKWQAQITYKGERIYLGYFDNFEEAVKVRREAEIKYFGEYRNIHNSI